MTITHFASDDLLLRYAAGRLSPAPAFVVACHLAMAQESRKRMDAMESMGGVLLDEQPMASLSDDLFERTLGRLNDEVPARQPPQTFDHAALNMGIELPAPMRRRSIGKWRFMGPGMRYARIDMPEDPGVNLVLLRVAAGQSLPKHGHSGDELTVILKGAYRDENGRYLAGDLDEEDDASEHTPVVEADSECICLAAISGPLQARGWVARAMLPMFGL